MQKLRLNPRTILIVAVLLSVATIASAQQREVALMHQVQDALRANDRLNGAKCYTAAPGVVVLYGTVFDDKDRAAAEQTASSVPGVNQVVDNLRTKTGKWVNEEERINTALLTNGFNDVQARVVGPIIYLSGQVTGQGQKARAQSVAASIYPDKQINNMIWEQPGSLF